MLPRIISKEQSETSALFGALIAIAENQVWLPAPTWLLTTLYNSRSRGSNTPFWPQWELRLIWTVPHTDAHLHRELKMKSLLKELSLSQ